MIKQLAGWQGKVNVNGQEFASISEVSEDVLKDTTTITLLPVVQRHRVRVEDVNDNAEHIITVRQYMTRPASPEFDFMDKWNNGIPMPMRTMAGRVVKETAKMVYMELHGYGKPSVYCVRCGKELTNPVSRYYGLGIECIQKVGIAREINDIEGIKEDLKKVEWNGWIIKSSIISDEIYSGGK